MLSPKYNQILIKHLGEKKTQLIFNKKKSSECTVISFGPNNDFIIITNTLFYILKCIFYGKTTFTFVCYRVFYQNIIDPPLGGELFD